MDWNICKHVDENIDYHYCRNKKQYGDFCKKHKRNHLIDVNNYIIHNNFTNKISDYLLKDLTYYYTHNINPIKGNHKKQFYFDEVSNYILNLTTNYEISHIINIQKNYRRYLQNRYKKCNNNEDFFTFDKLNKIPSKYFFMYQDLQGFYWGFDIRSLFKLIDFNKLNPYTTEVIPDNVLKIIQSKMKKLSKTSSYQDLESIIIKDHKEKIKRNVVDLFSDIEICGWSCQVEWFLSLSIRRLKELYKQLEDLWNYRLRECIDTKKRLSPPDGKLFTTPIINLSDYQTIQDTQELVIHDILKFKNISDASDRKLGYMYFLICLSYVSPECYITHGDWISATQ